MGARELIERQRVADAEFEFEVMGETLKARHIASADRYVRMEQEAASWIKAIAKKPENFGKPSDQIVRMCVYMANMMVDPVFTFDEALEAANTCGLFFFQVAGNLMSEAVMKTNEEEEEAIEDEGNASGAADGG